MASHSLYLTKPTPTIANKSEVGEINLMLAPVTIAAIQPRVRLEAVVTLAIMELEAC